MEVAKKRNSNDFSILDRIPCSCGDCKLLSQFLKDEGKKQFVWPLAKDRRQHIHQVIDGMGLEVSHTTQRTGSPHKLVLTKLDKHFEKEFAYRRQLAEYLERIQKLDG